MKGSPFLPLLQPEEQILWVGSAQRLLPRWGERLFQGAFAAIYVVGATYALWKGPQPCPCDPSSARALFSQFVLPISVVLAAFFLLIAATGIGFPFPSDYAITDRRILTRSRAWGRTVLEARPVDPGRALQRIERHGRATLYVPVMPEGRSKALTTFDFLRPDEADKALAAFARCYQEDRS